MSATVAIMSHDHKPRLGCRDAARLVAAASPEQSRPTLLLLSQPLLQVRPLIGPELDAIIDLIDRPLKGPFRGRDLMGREKGHDLVPRLRAAEAAGRPHKAAGD